jgi:hypothetical protein
MLSYLHEVLVDMLGHEPRLAAALLGETLAAGVPPGPVRVESAEFSDHAPTQYRADRVLVFGEGAAKVAIVAEVQNGFDQSRLRILTPLLWLGKGRKVVHPGGRTGCPSVVRPRFSIRRQADAVPESSPRCRHRVGRRRTGGAPE